MWLAFLFCWAGCSNPESAEPGASDVPPERLFVKRAPEQTGVTFANTLLEHPSPNRNLLLYEYFSNGAGVAVGDVNGDGLEDLYFAGNMSYNQLYLNQGNLSFLPVTDLAGVGGRINTWKTGVAMADVNGDGLLDLYLCYSGDLPLERRVDALYINQGNDAAGIPQFEEQAAAYGLAQPHSSNQAYFFDYDRDDDLDLLLLTHNVKNLSLPTEADLQAEYFEEDEVNGVRLYRNEGQRFVVVSAAAGLVSSAWTYGLGAGISDFNNDGWMDMYIGNDYASPDYLYINQQDGTFADELGQWMRHTSNASMGVDAADINNDGFSDVVVLDMLPESVRRQKTMFIPSDAAAFDAFVRMGFHRQYMRNMLQVNNGNGTFSEVGHLAGIAATDWSWTPLLADFDNDGYKDLFVSNGYLQDALDRDFLMFKRNFVARREAALEPEDVRYLMQMVPAVDMYNYAFRNRDGLMFEDISEDWGLRELVKSTGAAYADLDNDGDLDLILNNINAPAGIYENRAAGRPGHNHLQVELRGAGGNTRGIGARVYVYSEESVQLQEQMPMRGYLSGVGHVLHFGLGARTQVDSLRVVWPDGKTQRIAGIEANQRIEVHSNNGTPGGAPAMASVAPAFERIAPPFRFTHQMPAAINDFQRQPLMDFARSYSGPAMAAADVNGDGREDVFMGGGAGQASRLFLQRADGTFAVTSTRQFRETTASHIEEVLFFDANGDDAPDLYVAGGGYTGFEAGDPLLQDRLYLNDGAGNFRMHADALPEMYTSTGAVAAADINGDGALDLFVGGSVVPGRYPESPRSYVLINNGQGTYTDETARIAPALLQAGMVTDAVWHDLDDTGTPELVLAGWWMPLQVFEVLEDSLRDVSDNYFDAPYTGLWNTLLVDDLNRDGRADLVAGNLGLNAGLPADEAYPAVLYADDFNNDGQVDPLLAVHENGTLYPYATLDELYAQLPAVAGRFSGYRAYAAARLEEVLSRDRLAEAMRLEAGYLETALFLQQAGGRFERRPLPTAVQMAPVHAIAVVEGVNGKDLLLAGNSGEERVRVGRQDASYGLLLENDGNAAFAYVPQHRSGFSVTGPVRDIIVQEGRVLFGVNGSAVQGYRRRPGS